MPKVYSDEARERINSAVKKVESMPINLTQNKRFQRPTTAPSEAGSAIKIAKIKSGSGDEYTVDIYENVDADPVEEDVTLKILQIDSGEDIPDDTLLPCWQQSWGEDSTLATYWTADIARWY